MMTYWNMRAYSDADGVRPRTGTPDIRRPAQTQAQSGWRGGQVEIGAAGIEGHVTVNQRGKHQRCPE